MNDSIPTGLYRHYKGNRYQVIGAGTQTETGEKLVIYQPELAGDDSSYWIRPLDMFLETVEIDGIPQPRFEELNDS